MGLKSAPVLPFVALALGAAAFAATIAIYRPSNETDPLPAAMVEDSRPVVPERGGPLSAETEPQPQPTTTDTTAPETTAPATMPAASPAVASPAAPMPPTAASAAPEPAPAAAPAGAPAASSVREAAEPSPGAATGSLPIAAIVITPPAGLPVPGLGVVVSASSSSSGGSTGPVLPLPGLLPPTAPILLPTTPVAGPPQLPAGSVGQAITALGEVRDRIDQAGVPAAAKSSLLNAIDETLRQLGELDRSLTRP